MVVFDTGMNGGSTLDSPADSQHTLPPETPSPPPLQQHQRSIPLLCISDSNLPQKNFLGGISQSVHQHQLQSGGQNLISPHRSVGSSVGDVSDEGFRKDMRDLAELLSKLNPMAEEFVPSSLHGQSPRGFADGSADPLDFSEQQDIIGSSSNRNGGRRVSFYKFYKSFFSGRTLF